MDRQATGQRPEVFCSGVFPIFLGPQKSFSLFHGDDARYDNIRDFGWFQDLMGKDMSQKTCNSNGFDDWLHVEKTYFMSPWGLVGKMPQFPDINVNSIPLYNMMSHVL